LSRVGEVRRFDVAARPLRFMVDVAGGGARAVPLAGVLADALGLPVQETGVEAQLGLNLLRTAGFQRWRSR